mmetsp:Transcript_18363/g.56091  ORF Transcript_18363/g.56091 Transcript_18363/m.56091 type:complete len:251 (+) Transcript_18363:2144-2896(+)
MPLWMPARSSSAVVSGTSWKASHAPTWFWVRYESGTVVGASSLSESGGPWAALTAISPFTAMVDMRMDCCSSAFVCSTSARAEGPRASAWTRAEATLSTSSSSTAAFTAAASCLPARCPRALAWSRTTAASSAAAANSASAAAAAAAAAASSAAFLAAASASASSFACRFLRSALRTREMWPRALAWSRIAASSSSVIAASSAANAASASAAASAAAAAASAAVFLAAASASASSCARRFLVSAVRARTM